MTKQSEIDIEEGKYVIHVQALQKDADEASVMANYLSKSAIITKQDQTIYLTIMLRDHETVVGFQVENQSGDLVESIEQQVNEETNSRFEMFELDTLPSFIRAQVQYEVEHEGQNIKGDEALRLAFNEESVEKIE